MTEFLYSPGMLFLYWWIVAGTYVHYRGQVRHRFWRQLSDHSNVLAPINVWLYWFSAVPSRPFIDQSAFPQLSPLQENWQTIREEALALYDAGEIKSSDKLDDIGFNSFFRTGWRRFYLKWYGSSLPSAQRLCPRTVALLESIPGIKGAMFAALPPGARLVRHRDPYAGSIRYHLGLVTPGSDDCFLSVDGQKYSWRDGEAVMFDETYIHYAENQTDKLRIVLFADVERPLHTMVARWLNRLFGRIVLGASATPNLPGDKLGLLNRAFSRLYQIRQVGKRIKKRSKPVYYALKWLLLGGLVYLLLLHGGVQRLIA